MTDREVMQMALDALESSRVFVTTREKIKHPEGTEWYDERIEALRAALTQGEQENMNEPRNGWHLRDVWFEDGKPTMHREPSKPEPVAWMCPDDPDRETAFSWQSGHCVDCGKQKVPVYTTPPQRPWVGLTEQEAGAIMEELNVSAKLKEKNT